MGSKRDFLLTYIWLEDVLGVFRVFGRHSRTTLMTTDPDVCCLPKHAIVVRFPLTKIQLALFTFTFTYPDHISVGG